jgi:cytochrome d ubiquinol oxidase subunit II
MTIDWPTLLPLIAAAAMGATILIYVILDGFDLGIGILFAAADDAEKDRMISSIGPFWDANETWLVLAVGLLLVAFPKAHGVILTALYIPVFILLVGLILRGIAFDFRAKVPAHRKGRWNWIFFIGSLTASLAQGYMLGVYVLGLETGLGAMLFGLLTGVCAGGGLRCDGRGLADLQDRGRIAEEGRALAARRTGVHCAWHGGRIACNAACVATHL